MKTTYTQRFFLAAFVLLTLNASAQKLIIPEASQKAMVMQRIGLTDITISYHSPLVKERKVWGEIVPYDSVWRAGANENTTITFTTDVKIENQFLPAGTYGLHMIPTSSDWTIIFSKNSTSWGSFFYDKQEDALRVKVTPVESQYQEWLSYTFADFKKSSASILLRWEKLTVPIRLETDLNEIVFASMQDELRGADGFTWEANLQAANFCYANNIHLGEGKKWVEKSISFQENLTNLILKSKYLAKEGKTNEAKTVEDKAILIADEAQLNQHGYNLIAEKKTKEAIEIFKLNVKRYPNSWNVYDSLGEGYDIDRNNSEALKNYKLALAKAPQVQKDRINKIIKKLEGQKTSMK